MREKKWKHCPVCGAKNTMQPKDDLTERITLPGCSPLDIDGLDGQFCEECNEGFWSIKSERRITQLLAQHQAEHDSHSIVAADLASVREAAQTLHVSVQGIHKMMDEGRLRYALAGERRLPIRKDVLQHLQSKAHSTVRPAP